MMWNLRGSCRIGSIMSYRKTAGAFLSMSMKSINVRKMPPFFISNFACGARTTWHAGFISPCANFVIKTESRGRL